MGYSFIFSSSANSMKHKTGLRAQIVCKIDRANHCLFIISKELRRVKDKFYKIKKKE